MKRVFTALVTTAACLLIAGCQFSRDSRLTLVVETQSPIPPGDTLFVAGNMEIVGAWRPDGIALVVNGLIVGT